MLYYLKKVLGLASYADDLEHMNQAWKQAPTVLSVFSKVITGIANIGSQISNAMISAVSAVPGVSSALGTAASAAAATGGTMASVKAAMVTKTVVVAKTTALLGAVAVGAQAVVDTADTVENRVNQVRAVATDTLRHPINLDRALNPAYHGKRDQIEQGKKLTADYYRTKFGDDYQVTPYLGYGQPNLPRPTYRHLKLTAIIDGQRVEQPSQAPKVVNLIEEIDIDELIDLAAEKEMNPAYIVNLIEDKKLSQLNAVNLFQTEVADETVVELLLAEDYVLEQIQSEFEESVGGYWVEGDLSIVGAAPTEFVEHGIEFVEVERTETLTRTVVTCDDCTVPNPDLPGHFMVIDILGEEEYTNTFKELVARQTTRRYVKSFFEGSTNRGPSSYLRSLDEETIKKLITSSVAERYDHANVINQQIKDAGFDLNSALNSRHRTRRIPVRKVRGFR